MLSLKGGDFCLCIRYLLGYKCALALSETSNQPARCLKLSIYDAHGDLRLNIASCDEKKVYRDGMWKPEGWELLG